MCHSHFGESLMSLHTLISAHRCLNSANSSSGDSVVFAWYRRDGNTIPTAAIDTARSTIPLIIIITSLPLDVVVMTTPDPELLSVVLFWHFFLLFVSMSSYFVSIAVLSLVYRLFVDSVSVFDDTVKSSVCGVDVTRDRAQLAPI